MSTKALVLVVDDEMDARIFLYSLLDSEGYHVATCASAFEALRTVIRRRPEVVIADVRMPEIEGVELLVKIRKVSPETRVILYSAYGDWPMYFETLEKGGDDLLLKPSTGEEILRTVRRVLEKRDGYERVNS